MLVPGMFTRLGIVGAGYIGRIHAANLARLIGSAKLCGICDIEASKRQAAERDFGVNAYASVSELVSRECLDGLLICTPPFIRWEILGSALAMGIKGVFVEKPLALTDEEARMIINACRVENVILHVGLAYRFQRTTQKAVELIKSGRLGQVRLICSEFWTGVPGPPWWKDRRRSGGLLLDQCAHLFDLIRLCGGPATVSDVVRSGSIGLEGVEMPIDEAIVVNLRFENGGIGSLTATCRCPFPEASEVSVRVVGTKGAFILNPRVAELRVWEASNPSHLVFTDASAGIDILREPKEMGYVRELEAFVGKLRQEDLPWSGVDGNEAYDSLMLGLQAEAFCEKNFQRAVAISSGPTEGSPSFGNRKG